MSDHDRDAEASGPAGPHTVVLPTATVSVSESLLIVSPAIGFMEVDAITHLDPSVEVRVLLPRGLSRSEGTREFARDLQELGEAGHAVEVRFASGLASQRCVIVDGERIYPEPGSDGNYYMRAIGAGGDVARAIELTEREWEKAEPVDG